MVSLAIHFLTKLDKASNANVFKVTKTQITAIGMLLIKAIRAAQYVISASTVQCGVFA